MEKASKKKTSSDQDSMKNGTTKKKSKKSKKSTDSEKENISVVSVLKYIAEQLLIQSELFILLMQIFWGQT